MESKMSESTQDALVDMVVDLKTEVRELRKKNTQLNAVVEKSQADLREVYKQRDELANECSRLEVECNDIKAAQNTFQLQRDNLQKDYNLLEEDYEKLKEHLQPAKETFTELFNRVLVETGWTERVSKAVEDGSVEVRKRLRKAIKDML
jgi:chromosome segregation ATPase